MVIKKKMKILTIIPAKTDSTRLPKKNIQKIKGKTLVEYSIDYAKQSKYNSTIVVSSESDEVLKIALDNEVTFVERPAHLLKDAEVTDVYIDLLNSMNEKFDLVVCLQPDHPDREHTFDYCVDYLIDNNYDDLITIEPSFKRSGSVRVFKYEHLMNGHVSKRIGCIKDDATDIHYQEDLERAKTRI
jgi:CMP-N,N'-diacetyllegionaminic acid synthase